LAREGFLEPENPNGNLQRTSAETAILVDRMTAPLIKEDGILTEGRVQYITLQLPDSSELSIINTYAPRASRDRVPLWKKISEANFSAELSQPYFGQVWG